MVKIGMMIAERYEVLEKIGTGGMSDVYRAKDHKLNRYVAIKVLKQEFSENKDFVSKFRVEAQAAAGLMHPNIVNVYDVGEESGFHYIVMELVEGITLKKYIEKKARLSVKEAVSIAIQVAMGIEAAHNNHIIHRDIKPQNIIISKEGKVKVTDFGIAKAATSNTITSNVMGSVHYTSPEQVRGGFSDEKSDIYSLGITLFEMLTGRVPFNGETTVAVAIKHIQEPMPTPRNYVPEIPVSVEQIVLKCTQKSPDRRYQSAPELIEDLKRSLISPNENFVKIESTDSSGATKEIEPQDLKKIKQQVRARDDYDAHFAGRDDADGSEKGKLKKYKGTDTSEIYDDYDPETGEGYGPEDGYYQDENYEEPYPEDYPEEYPEDYPEEQYPQDELPAGGYVIEEMIPPRNPRKNRDDAGARQNGKSQKKGQPAAKNGKKSQGKSASSKNVPAKNSQAAARQRRRTTESYEDEYDSKMEVLTTALIVIAALVVGIILLYIVASAMGIFDKRDNPLGEMQEKGVVEMPDVTNLTSREAQEKLEDLGLMVNLVPEASIEVENGKVIRTSISAGEKVTALEAVTIYYSTGGDGTSVPNVTGKSRAEAVSILEAEGFIVNVSTENSDEVEKDQVIRQDPEGESRTSRGGEISIVISAGKAGVSVPMPKLIGLEADEAVALLVEKGLIAVEGDAVFSDEYEEGIVAEQNVPEGRTVNSGTEITYKLSKGPEPAFYSVYYTIDTPPGYNSGGGDAEILLEAADGTQIYTNKTSNFPVVINVTGIHQISGGELSLSYPVWQEEVRDDAGNIISEGGWITMYTPKVHIDFEKQ
ncbi:MAG: Stk1 family PASTA domain-containing Ser/Thr kinase [Lachnospiraceae bacterium]|nr:Stk1 family PASTA domain-containing Ser/Thr kinase [Lachnospiraceae bacterium]